MLKFNEYVGKDANLRSEQVAAIFAKRYRLGLWFAGIPFATVVVIGVLLVKKIIGNEAGLLFICCVLTILAYIHFIYRCPRCGEVPKSSTPGTTGVLLFPKKCSKCHAPLLPHHKWGQD